MAQASLGELQGTGAATLMAAPGDDAEAYYKNGLDYLKKGDLDRAIAEFDQALVLAKRDSKGLHPRLRQAQVDGIRSQIADLKSEVEGKVAALRSALQSGGIDQIRSAMNELSESMQKIGAAAYGQGGPEMAPGAEGPEGGEPSAPPEEGTVEGEFREV